MIDDKDIGFKLWDEEVSVFDYYEWDVVTTYFKGNKVFYQGRVWKHTGPMSICIEPREDSLCWEISKDSEDL